jgi:DNA-binding MarR family transcriptional regulator
VVDRNRQAELRDAIEALYFGYRAFTDRADRILERRGLGRLHHRILYFVGRHPEVSVTGLLRILAISKQAINVPLRQLGEMQLVAQSAAPEDRRVKRLRLTTAGQRLEAELTGAQMRQLEAAFDAAGRESEAGWAAVMARLAARADQST